MGATYSLGAYLEDDSITLEDVPSKKHPKGKAYTFMSPSFETGLWLKNLLVFGRKAALATVLAEIGADDEDGQAAAADVEATAELGKLVLDDNEEVDVYRRVMGATFEQLRADDVSWGHVQNIFGLLLRHWGSAQTIEDALTRAELAKVGDVLGEAQTQPNRQTRRANARGSSPKAGSKSSPTSSGTKARTAGPASTRSSGTSAARKRTARKAV